MKFLVPGAVPPIVFPEEFERTTRVLGPDGIALDRVPFRAPDIQGGEAEDLDAVTGIDMDRVVLDGVVGTALDDHAALAQDGAVLDGVVAGENRNGAPCPKIQGL